MKKNIVILIVVLIALGAAAWFGLQKSEAPSVPTGPAAQSPDTQQPQIDTTNWKTYRNEKYGFEFRYPTDYSTKNYSIGPVGKEKITSRILFAPEESSRFLDVVPSPNTKGAAWRDQYETDIDCIKTTFADTPAYRCLSMSRRAGETEIALEKNGNIIRLIYGDPPIDVRRNLDLTLSTFKFVK